MKLGLIAEGIVPGWQAGFGSGPTAWITCLRLSSKMGHHEGLRAVICRLLAQRKKAVEEKIGRIVRNQSVRYFTEPRRGEGGWTENKKPKKSLPALAAPPIGPTVVYRKRASADDISK